MIVDLRSTSSRQAQDERDFVARLTAKARQLGLARAEALLLERGGGPERRWRKSRLLWPLMGGE